MTQEIQKLNQLITYIECDQYIEKEFLNEILSKFTFEEQENCRDEIFFKLARALNCKSIYFVDDSDQDSLIAAFENIYNQKIGKNLCISLDYEFDYTMDDIAAIAIPKFNEHDFDVWIVDLNIEIYAGFIAQKSIREKIKELLESDAWEFKLNPAFKSQIITDEGILHLAENSYLEYDYGENVSAVSKKQFRYTIIFVVFLILLFATAMLFH